MKRKLVILIVVVFAAGLGYEVWKWWLPAASGELTLYGNVDIREVNLGFRVGGKIKEVLKEEGDEVKPGEIVARLDDEPYKHEVAQAEGQLFTAKAKLEQLKTGYRKEEIAQARANAEEQKATVCNAERVFVRQKELRERAVTSQQDYDDASANLDVAKSKLASLLANLTLQESGYRREEIEQAQGDYDAAVAALATSKVHLQDTVLRAPSAGMVITRALEPGAVVAVGATVLTVSLFEPVWVRAYVAEPNLGWVAPGTPAFLFTDSQPGRAYEGQVGFVSPRAEFTPKTVETPDLRTGLVYQIRVVVTQPDARLRQGMPVTVQIKRK